MTKGYNDNHLMNMVVSCRQAVCNCASFGRKVVSAFVHGQQHTGESCSCEASVRN